MKFEKSNAKQAIHSVVSSIMATILWVGGAVAAEVELLGPVSDDLRQKLRNGSLLATQADPESEPVSVQEIVSAAQADYKRLLAVMYDAGYFGPTITIRLDGREASTIPAVNAPSSVSKAVIMVTPGKKFRFGRAEIQPLPGQTVQNDAFRTGEVASLGVLRQAVSDGVEAWRDRGYAKAELKSQQITARHPQGEIDAQLTLAPGPQLRFGALQIKGNSAVRTERIYDIAGLPEGQVFSPEEVTRAAARLRRAGAFSSVAMIEAPGIGPNNTQTITAQVAEAKPRRFGIGAEVDTSEGLSLRGYWLHRNYFGGAERLQFNLDIEGIGGDTGGVNGRIGARFERPATFNEDTNFYALAEAEQLDEENYFSRQISVEAGIERFANEKRTYRFGLGILRGFTRDTFGENYYTLFQVPLGAEFDYRDRPLDALKGYYANIDVTPFLAISGADDGVRTYADLRAYHTFGESKSTTLALRGQLGSLFGPSLAEAPGDYLFYSGGGGTVRGHDYQSLGVDLGGGNIVGGRSFVNFTAEVRWRSSGNLGLVGFIDTGYIGEEEFFDGSGEWHSGAGLGLRYDTGIGPIRVDLAVPVSGDRSDSDYQIYIGVGQSF